MIIPTVKNTKTITDLREQAVKLLNQVQKEGPTYIFHHSKPRAVMLSIEEYSHLLETMEDYIDILEAKDIEAYPEKGGLTLKGLAVKYKLNV